MNFNRQTEVFYNSPEILATEKNLVSFSITLSDIGVVADAKGKKIVKKGS